MVSRFRVPIPDKDRFRIEAWRCFSSQVCKTGQSPLEAVGMNADVWIVGGILAVAIVLFVTEWVRVDLVALMVMLGLVLGNVLEG